VATHRQDKILVALVRGRSPRVLPAAQRRRHRSRDRRRALDAHLRREREPRQGHPHRDQRRAAQHRLRGDRGQPAVLVHLHPLLRPPAGQVGLQARLDGVVPPAEELGRLRRHPETQR